MKSTTQQILSFIESDNFRNLSTLREKVVSYGWGNPEYQEMNFEESISELEIISNLLENSINDKNLFFENIFTFQERNSILSIFQNLNSYITNTKNDSNQINNFIQYIQQLKSQINRSYLDIKIKGYPSYEEKLKQVSYLKQKYEKLIQDLDKAEGLKKQSDDILSSISKKDEQTEKHLNSVSESKIKIESSEKDINSRHEAIKILNSNIVQYEAETKQNKESILAFFKKTDEYETKIKSGLENIDKTIKDSDTEMKKAIEENNVDTTNIISENQKLQKTIYDILGKAIGTNLYKSFNEKSKWMLWQSIFWLIIFIVSLVLLSFIGFSAFSEIKNLINSNNNNITSLGLLFFMRLTLIFPTLYGVYVASNQFKNTVNLREEYEFKSSVAVALHHFKEIVEKSEKEQDKQFLIDSIKSIFESPTEKVFGKKTSEKDLNSKAKDIVSDVADITGKFFPKEK